MGVVESIKSGFANYVTFSGRACRSGFWYFTLFLFLVGMATSMVDKIIFGHESLFYFASVIVTLLPNVSYSVRRLHDVNRSGWWWLNFIPVIGWIILIIWYCTKGTDGDNRFGLDPLAQVAAGA